MTPEQQAIIDILEDSKYTAYEFDEYNSRKSGEDSYSAVLVLSPTAIDRIKDLFSQLNFEQELDESVTRSKQKYPSELFENVNQKPYILDPEKINTLDDIKSILMGLRMVFSDPEGEITNYLKPNK